MILVGTPILLASGRTKPVEKLRPGDVLRSHTGEETTLRELVPLRSKKNILLILGKHFVVMHHDQPVLSTYGWMRTRMLRIGDHLAAFHQTGGGSAGLLWTDSQRDWEGRLAKVDFRTLNIPPWPSPSIGKIARRAAVSSAMVRPIVTDSHRVWTERVEAQRKSGLTIAAFLEDRKLSYTVGYFANWITKVRQFEENAGSSQPGFDLICDGGFVIPVGGADPPLFIVCRDGAKYEKPPRVQDEADEDEDLDVEDDEGPVSTKLVRSASTSASTSSARSIVSKAPPASRSRRNTPVSVAHTS